MDKMSIEDLYTWVNSRYESHTKGEISEADYLSDLEYYKEKLAFSTDNPVTTEEPTELPKSTKVRSASIAGLRSKLINELRD